MVTGNLLLQYPKRTTTNHDLSVNAFPIGIDPDTITEGLQRPKVQERIAALERKFQGVKIIVGVDRLDYIKGVPQKLHALEVFLTEHPEWIGKVRRPPFINFRF